MQRPRHRKTRRIESDTSWAHGSQERDLRTLPTGAPGDTSWAHGSQERDLRTLPTGAPGDQGWPGSPPSSSISQPGAQRPREGRWEPEGEHRTPAPLPPVPLHHVSISCPLLLHLITSLTRPARGCCPPRRAHSIFHGRGQGMSQGHGLSPTEGVCSSTWLSWELLSMILKPPVSPGSPVCPHLTP